MNENMLAVNVPNTISIVIMAVVAGLILMVGKIAVAKANGG